MVFTKTLDKSVWDNTVLAKGELEAEVMQLKQQDGNDIIAYGGGSFVSHLIRENLIDDYYLFHLVGRSLRLHERTGFVSKVQLLG